MCKFRHKMFEHSLFFFKKVLHKSKSFQDKELNILLFVVFYSTADDIQKRVKAVQKKLRQVCFKVMCIL
jgi:hypothetical protein